jgi:hypothetical protein
MTPPVQKWSTQSVQSFRINIWDQSVQSFRIKVVRQPFRMNLFCPTNTAHYATQMQVDVLFCFRETEFNESTDSTTELWNICKGQDSVF